MKFRWKQVATRVLAPAVVLACGFTCAGQTKAPQVAVTFDDLPVHGPLPPGETRLEIAQRVIRALHAAHVPPTYGFVNGIWVQKQPETIRVLQAWRAAGNPLGNHTWSHMNLNQHSLEQFEADILKNEPLLKSQMGGEDWQWLRFPYLAEGDTIEKRMGIRAFLAQHGYKIADVTMSFADYNWNEPYARCAEKHDGKAIAWLESSYLQAADEDIVFRRTMAKELYHQDIPYVLLMHIGAFDARMLPRLLRQYRRKGFRFVSLADAEKNPFYRFDVNPKLLPGPDTLEAAMAEKHLPLPPHKDYSQQLQDLCK